MISDISSYLFICLLIFFMLKGNNECFYEYRWVCKGVADIPWKSTVLFYNIGQSTCPDYIIIHYTFNVDETLIS